MKLKGKEIWGNFKDRKTLYVYDNLFELFTNLDGKTFSLKFRIFLVKLRAAKTLRSSFLKFQKVL